MIGVHRRLRLINLILNFSFLISQGATVAIRLTTNPNHSLI